MTDSKTAEVHEIDGYEVAFVPWHSEYMDEDFVAVSVRQDGRELMHAGMTKMQPSEQRARRVVDDMLAVMEVGE